MFCEFLSVCHENSSDIVTVSSEVELTYNDFYLAGMVFIKFHRIWDCYYIKLNKVSLRFCFEEK